MSDRFYVRSFKKCGYIVGDNRAANTDTFQARWFRRLLWLTYLSDTVKTYDHKGNQYDRNRFYQKILEFALIGIYHVL